MSQREQIQRMYEREGLDALWQWARGKPDRWKALKEWAEAKARQARKELNDERRDIEQAEDELHELGDRLRNQRANKAKNKADIAEAEEKGDDARVRELEKRAREIQKAIDATLAEVKDEKTEKKRSRVAAHRAKRERLAWIERKIVYREQWEKAKKRQQDKKGGFKNAEWEDWMGHGLDANVTPFVKKVVAWGVLDYDLVATSLRRTYVPPGGSTTSYHLQTPGKAGDIAGARMSEFQAALYEEFLGNGAMLEMFGPINDKCLKYGQRLVLGEGTGLEQLHDTHVHAAG